MKLRPLLAALLWALPWLASAQVSFTGSYSENFNSMGTGTSAPSGWTFHGNLGGNNDSWTATTGIPASGSPSAATAGTANATLTVNSNAASATASSNTAGYNFALSTSTTDRCVGTSPTSGAGVVWQLRLTNNSGSAVSQLSIGYEIRRFTTVSTAEALPGFRLFVSTNSGSSWTNVSALNPVLSGGTVNVPSSSGVTTVAATTITLPSSVATGGDIRFRWIDDNGPPSPDQILGLDNVTIQALNPPTVSITAPANDSSFVVGTDFEVTATAADSNGTVSQVEFLRNGTVVGTDASEPYSLPVSGLEPGRYSFTARATDNDGQSTTSTAVAVTVTLDPANLPANTALLFDGVNDHVTMGAAPALNTGGPPSNGFTLECWFRRDGAGVTASSGTGGVVAVPLFAKGRGEVEGDNRDCNYIFGIDANGQLVADFEAYPASGITSGQNYPVTGSHTAIVQGRWYHAAVTFDGNARLWTLYLDGRAVGTATVPAGALPRYDSIQHFSIGTAMTSTGTREGAFHGVIDEVRVWNTARSAADIEGAMNLEISAATGLVGRFGLNEGTGTSTASTAGDATTGTLTNGPLWVNGAPFGSILIERTAIAKGSTWKYLDDGSNQGTAWKESAFNDSAWASGPAKLGYEDGAVTVLRQGPDGMTSTTKYITYYFRRTFNLTGAASVREMVLNILRDDGVVVYINGVEVARQNMPAGAVDYLTDSTTTVSGADETTYFPAIPSPLPALVEGENVIAVELHQRDNASSDLGFDLEMILRRQASTPPTVAILTPADAASFSAPGPVALTAQAEDSDGTIIKVEYFSGATKIGEATSAPYAFSWTGVPQGGYTLTARATDDAGLTVTSAPVSITVGPPNTVPPTVAITSPAQAASFLAPASITIEATAADTDGSVAKVEFFQGGTKLGEDTSAPYSFVWTGVGAGDYALTARATDDLTAATTSATVNVTVVPNQAPSIALASPADAATGVGVGGTVNLQATVADPEGQPLNVTFYGRLKRPPPGEDFTLVTLPDTQFYSENSGGNRFQLFTNQTNWIVASKNLLNTQFVAHMGDMTQSYNTVEAEYVRADQAMDIIEDPATTLLTHGIPWGGAPGNHDIASGGSTAMWNQYFGLSRWAGRPYFGGGYNSTTDQNWQTFRAGGLDFIVINLKYETNTSGNAAVLNWADALLKAYPNHRAIVTSHWLINTSFPPTQATWGGHGQAVYDSLKDNPNLFLMLCGHIHGEGRRVDTFEGRNVYTVLQDYQSRTNGGDSWLRYFTFKPSENKIYAYTYKSNTAPVGSPLGGTFETDADSQFTLDYDMSGGSTDWVPLGTAALAAGETSATLAWTGVAPETEYEWYAAVSDGVTPVGSSTRSFTTAGNQPPTVSLTAPLNNAAVALPSQVLIEADAADTDGSISRVEFYSGSTKIGEDSSAPYTLAWTPISGSYSLTARAFDNQDTSTDSAPVSITVTNPNNELPTVAITAPANGSIQAAGTIELAATASDTDGVVAKVEFFQGSTKIGEDTTAPYSLSWSSVTPGDYTLTAVATDNDNGTRVSAAVTVAVRSSVSSTLIARRPSGQPGAVWKYLDNGSDQGTAWRETAFNDSSWASGAAPLGYGDSHIVTTINSGPSGSRIITTYLRRTFSVASAALVRSLALNILRDDGVVVYINGVEVARQNMPEGPVNYLTNSASITDGANETTYFPSAITTLPPLVDGLNVIAVELHNRDANSSDLGFDLELTAQSILPDPTAVTQAASSISPTGTVLNGVVNPRGNNVTAWFEYGLTDAYGQTAAITLSPANGTTDQNVSATLTGLPQDTTHFYRLVVQGPEATVRGSGLSFATSSRRLGVTGKDVPIANGDDTPSADDDTAFGAILTGSGEVKKTFTLVNAGTSPAMLSGTPRVALSGSSSFRISQQPASDIVAANGGTQAFEVAFDHSILGPHQAVVSIASDDPVVPLRTFQISAETVTGGAHTLGAALLTLRHGSTGAQVSISRSGTAPSSVRLTTADGTASTLPPFSAALAGVDYTAADTLVEFAQGETRKTVTIPLLARPAATPNRRFSVSLSEPSTGSSLGAITTAEVRLLGADNLRPGLSITSPGVPGMTVSATSPFLSTGTVGDAGGIDRVEVVLNGAAPVRAVLGSAVVPTAMAWSLSITPRAGANTLLVSAYDLTGNVVSVARSFTFVQRQSLSVRRSGPSGVPLDDAGRVDVLTTPAATTALPLVPHASPRGYAALPGKAVRLTAVPGRGHLFSHWAAMPAGAAVAGAVLTFTMPAQDVAAEAVFVENPLLSTTGEGNVFAGLLRPEPGTPAGNATYGHITATVVPATGALSGRVTINGVSQTFSGVIMGAGTVQFLPGNTPALTFDRGTRSLTLALSSGGIKAQVEAGTLISTGTLARAAHSAANPLPGALLNDRVPASAPAPNRAYLTLALPAKAQTPARPAASYPQGDGHGTLVLDTEGMATLAGVLADGTGITASTVVVEGDVMPVFARLRTPGTTVDNAATLALSSISGTLTLDASAADSDVTGTDLTWFRPAVVQRVTGSPGEVAATRLYTAGWPDGIVVDAVGARYDRASTVQASLGLAAADPVNGNAEILMTEGKLAFANEIRALNIVGNAVGKLPVTNPEFTLVPVANTGFFSGVFTPNWTGANVKVKPGYRGIILQKGASKGGYGFFLSNRLNDLDPESGRVTLGAP